MKRKLLILEELETIRSKQADLSKDLKENNRELTEAEVKEVEEATETIRSLEGELKVLEQLEANAEKEVVSKEVVRSVEVVEKDKNSGKQMGLIEEIVRNKKATFDTLDLKRSIVATNEATTGPNKTDAQGTFEDRPIMDGLLEGTKLGEAGVFYDSGVSDIHYSVFTGVTGVAPVDEGAENEGNYGFEDIYLKPKEYQVNIPISRKAWKQDQTGSLARVIADLPRAFAVRVEQDALSKTQVDKGIDSLYVSAGQSIAAVGTLDAEKFQQAYDKLAEADANADNGKAIMSPLLMSKLKTSEAVTSSPNLVNGTTTGMINEVYNSPLKVIAKPKLYQDAVIVADWSKAVIVQFGDMTIIVDDTSNGGKVIVRAHTMFASAWITPDSAVKMTGVTN